MKRSMLGIQETSLLGRANFPAHEERLGPNARPEADNVPFCFCQTLRLRDEIPLQNVYGHRTFVGACQF